MADGMEGDPPDVVEPAADSSVGEAAEEGVPSESPVEETTPPSIKQPSTVLPPTLSTHCYPARDRQLLT